MATQGKEPTQAATQIVATLGREGNQWEEMITIRVVIRWQPRLVSSNQMATQIGNPGIGANSNGNPDCRIRYQHEQLRWPRNVRWQPSGGADPNSGGHLQTQAATLIVIGSRENGSLIRSLIRQPTGKTGVWG